MIVTLDHNCIVALEKPDLEAEVLRTLATLCKMHHVTLAVYTWMRLENPASGTDHRDLEMRLQAIGLEHAVTMSPQPLGYERDGDIVFDNRWAYGVKHQVHAILSPKIDFDFHEYVERMRPADDEALQKLERVWNNAKSDSLALYAAISWGPGIFVTNDNDFHKKTRQEQLSELAPDLKILRPPDALVAIREYIGTQAQSITT